MGNRGHAIHDAVVAGDLEGLRSQWSDPAFPNVHDECGQPLLGYVVCFGPQSLVRALLRLGADPEYRFPDPDAFREPGNALFSGLERRAPDRLEVLALLLEAGADIGGRGLNDYTPLHQAACADDAEGVEFLLRRGADPSLRTRIDWSATPLEEAEHHGCEAAAQVLRRWQKPGSG